MQSFNKASRKGYNQTQMDKAAQKLRNLPTSGGSLRYASLGHTTGNGARSAFSPADVKSHFKLGNIKNIILDECKDIMFNQVDEELVTELFDNSTSD